MVLESKRHPTLETSKRVVPSESFRGFKAQRLSTTAHARNPAGSCGSIVCSGSCRGLGTPNVRSSQLVWLQHFFNLGNFAWGS